MTDALELIYTSTSTAPFSDQDLHKLLSNARGKNLSLNVTGLLCYDKERFLQIIEGPEEHINQLYSAIKNDTRHKNVELIHKGKVETRAFDDWRMAFQFVPTGLLDILSDSMAVTSFEQTAIDSQNPNASFGSRLFSIFIESIYNPDDDSNL